MAIPADIFTLSEDSQKRLIHYLQEICSIQANVYNTRNYLEEIDRSYMRELDFSVERYKQELVKRKGDVTKFRNVIMPVVMPQVESAVTFQSDMFLSGFPIFGVTSTPQYENQALQMDSIIGKQQLSYGWVIEYQQSFRNGFKYNLLGMEIDWDRIKTFSVGTEEETTSSNLTELVEEGNKVKNLDLYNTIWDPRVLPSKVATEGEFAGYMKMYSRNSLKVLMNNLGDGVFNTKEALASGLSISGSGVAPYDYYFPQLNPNVLIRPESMATTSWEGFWNGDNSGVNEIIRNKALYSNYQVTKFYAKICPADFKIFNVPSPTVPQNWKFYIVNNSVMIYAERLSNAHQYLPILFAQPYDDGLGYQTKSLATNVGPIQEVVTALANSSISSRRRAVSDRGLYDPSRVSAAHINNDNPTAKIPVKPNSFGANLSDAYYPIPFRDDQFQINSAEIQQYMSFGNSISGNNPARQGQFVKGNKTRTEYVDVQSNAGGRDRTVAQALEVSLMLPSKKIIKSNILQYQRAEVIYNPDKQVTIQVDPVQLRKAMLEFKLSDGLLPSERIMDGESLTIALQTLQSVPQLAQAYNIAPMFSYIMKSRGANLVPFEKSPEQLAYEQAMMQWQQSVAMVAQQLSENKELPNSQLQQLIKNLPPQPTPQQFGYNPQQGTQVPEQDTILNQIAAISEKQSQANES